MNKANDEPETINDLCPKCGEVNAHTIDAEPALATIQVLDCRGEVVPARIGLPIVRCTVCGTTSPQSNEGQRIAMQAALATIRRSFHLAMSEMERGRRNDVFWSVIGTVWLCIGVLIAATHRSGGVWAMPAACLCGVLGGALVTLAWNKRYTGKSDLRSATEVGHSD